MPREMNSPFKVPYAERKVMPYDDRLANIAARLTIAVAKAELAFEAAEKALKPRKRKGKVEPYYEFSDRCHAVRTAHRRKIGILTARRDAIRKLRGIV